MALDRQDSNPCIMDLGFKGLTEQNVGNVIKNACEQYYLKQVKESPNKEKVINLKYNELERLDTDNIPDVVQRLLVNVNKIHKIPALKEYKNLKEVSLSSNEISEIDVTCLPLQIEELKLNHNKIKVVPNLQKFTKLRVLHLENNHIEEILGLPESLECLKLKGNSVSKLAVECFPNEKVFDVVKSTFNDEQVKEMKEPKPILFLSGYSKVMDTFLKQLKRKLNRIFQKHPSLKVQGLYIDDVQHKIIVNVEKDETLKVKSMLEKQMEPYIQIIEQPNSPKWLASNSFRSGSKIQMEGKNSFGTITAKVVDSPGNIYALTCKHVFSKVAGAKKEENVPEISTETEDGKKVSLGKKFYGVLGAYTEDNVNEAEDLDPLLVDVALVPITNEAVKEKFKSDIADNDKKPCYLHLYKGENSCNQLKKATNVCKVDTITGFTYGTVLQHDFTYYFNKDNLHREALETIMIKSHSTQKPFFKDGDSGSLVTTNLSASSQNHCEENHAVGIAIAGHKDMNVPITVDETMKVDAGIAVKLHICLEALEKKFPELNGLKLCCNDTVMKDCP